MPTPVARLEEIAVEQGYAQSPEGVIELLNALFQAGKSASEIERDLNLGSTYITTYCSRRNIEITTETVRSARFKEPTGA